MNKKLFNCGYCPCKCLIYKHRVDADVPYSISVISEGVSEFLEKMVVTGLISLSQVRCEGWVKSFNVQCS